MNVLVMYDRQTESLWSQLLGEAVQGELIGTKLEYLPSLQTTWTDWKQRYPDTLALKKGYYGDKDPYHIYYGSGDAGVIGENSRDTRLFTKEFVIGVEQNGESIAFPFSVLNDNPVINHSVGGLEVLVVFNLETGTGVVYNRDVGGKILTFESRIEHQLIDHETASTWDAMTGKAIRGPLTGEIMDRVKSTSSFWFGWKDWYPDTFVYGIDAD